MRFDVASLCSKPCHCYKPVTLLGDSLCGLLTTGNLVNCKKIMRCDLKEFVAKIFTAGSQHASIERTCLALLAAIALLGAGCRFTDIAPTSAAALAEADPVANFYSTNILHEGDVVNVIFQYATNYSTLQRIGLDGTLNMNSVGPVRAAGRTEIELQQDLANAYKSLAKDDVITVNRVMNSTAIIYVSGAVLKPGPVDLSHPLTVIEAVMAAGGFDNTRAKLSAVSILRMEHGQQHAYKVNLKRVLAGEEQTPFYLRPFDIVYVPTKKFNY